MKYDIAKSDLGIKINNSSEATKIVLTLKERFGVDCKWILEAKEYPYYVGSSTSNIGMLAFYDKKRFNKIVSLKTYLNNLKIEDNFKKERKPSELQLENKRLRVEVDSLLESSRLSDEKVESIKSEIEALEKKHDSLLTSSSSLRESFVEEKERSEKLSKALFKLIESM